MSELLFLSKRLLNDGGSFYVIYPSWRLPDMICAMRDSDIEPKKLIMVHSHIKSRASLFLIKGIKGAGKEMLTEAPIVVYDKSKEYTDKMNQVFEKLVI
jgi:tRNA1Val (adenine37-N6)-methyltransferase